jgi:hypothetical protein
MASLKKWQSDKMASWQNIKLAKQRVNDTIHWCNEPFTQWQFDETPSYQN